MIKDDCIFCKIANGVIPSAPVYEDDSFKVILDLAPANKGHALILPKQHFDNCFSMDDETASKVFPLAKKVATAIKEEFNCDGVNILQNNGEAAGQTVFHFHTHIIPRYKDDTATITWKQLTTEPAEQEKLAASLNERISK